MTPKTLGWCGNQINRDHEQQDVRLVVLVPLTNVKPRSVYFRVNSSDNAYAPLAAAVPNGIRLDLSTASKYDGMIKCCRSVVRYASAAGGPAFSKKAAIGSVPRRKVTCGATELRFGGNAHVALAWIIGHWRTMLEAADGDGDTAAADGGTVAVAAGESIKRMNE